MESLERLPAAHGSAPGAENLGPLETGQPSLGHGCGTRCPSRSHMSPTSPSERNHPSPTGRFQTAMSMMFSPSFTSALPWGNVTLATSNASWTSIFVSKTRAGSSTRTTVESRPLLACRPVPGRGCCGPRAGQHVGQEGARRAVEGVVVDVVLAAAAAAHPPVVPGDVVSDDVPGLAPPTQAACRQRTSRLSVT